MSSRRVAVFLVVAMVSLTPSRPSGSDALAAVGAALDAGRYEEAERLARALLASSSGGARERARPARVVHLLVQALVEGGKGNAPETLSLANRGVQLAHRDAGLVHPDMADALDDLGSVETARGEFRAAVTRHQRAAAIRAT